MIPIPGRKKSILTPNKLARIERVLSMHMVRSTVQDSRKILAIKYRRISSAPKINDADQDDRIITGSANKEDL